MLTNDHFQRNILNKLYILSTFSNISLPFHEVHLIEGRTWTTLLNHEQLFDVNQTLLAKPLKNKFSPSSDLHLYQWLIALFTRVLSRVSYYHVTYAFQSEFTLNSCLNVKELFARNRGDIWSLSEQQLHGNIFVLIWLKQILIAMLQAFRLL